MRRSYNCQLEVYTLCFITSLSPILTPDGKRFIDVLMGRAQGKPPLVEYLVDEVLRKPITTDLLGRQWVDDNAGDRATRAAALDNFIEFWQRLGYDFVRYEEAMPFARRNCWQRTRRQDRRSSAPGPTSTRRSSPPGRTSRLTPGPKRVTSTSSPTST